MSHAYKCEVCDELKEGLSFESYYTPFLPKIMGIEVQIFFTGQNGNRYDVCESCTKKMLMPDNIEWMEELIAKFNEKNPPPVLKTHRKFPWFRRRKYWDYGDGHSKEDLEDIKWD